MINEGTEPGITQPTQPERSGSPDVARQVGHARRAGPRLHRPRPNVGPTREQLTDFNGKPAKEPIRVYVGLESADSLDERGSTSR